MGSNYVIDTLDELNRRKAITDKDGKDKHEKYEINVLTARDYHSSG